MVAKTKDDRAQQWAHFFEFLLRAYQCLRAERVVVAPFLLSRRKAIFMRSCRVVALILVGLFCVFPARAQEERKLGDFNGYDWTDFHQEATKFFGSEPLPDKEGWVNALERSTKLVYVTGTLNSVSYFRSVVSDSLGGSLYEDFNGVTVGQVVSFLDEFYGNYANMQVKIMEAIMIGRSKIHGASDDEIAWLTRYYRTDEAGRIKMWQDGPTHGGKVK